MRGTSRWIALLLALTLVAAACGGDDDGGTFAGSGEGGDGGIEAFCDLAQEQEDLEGGLEGGDLNIFDPESVESAFSELSAIFDRALDVAPDEIKGDFEILQDNFSTIEDALVEADFDFLAVDQALLEDSAEVDAASDRIDAFVETECGIVADEDDEEGISDEQLAEQLEESGRGAEVAAFAFESAGFSADQAACLAERITFEQALALGDSGDDLPPEFAEALDACGVTPTQLFELGAGAEADLDLNEESVEDLLDEMEDVAPSIGGGELPPEAIDGAISALVAEGFTQEEAECLVPSFLDTDSEDPLAAFEDCGISLSRLAELGG